MIRLAPDFKDSYLNLGKIYYKGKEYSNALAAFEKLSVKDPNNVELTLLIGDVCKKLKMVVEAEKSYNRAVELDPERIETYKALVILYHDFGDHEQALAYVQKGLGYAKEDVELLELQARSLKGLKRYQEAAAVYKYIITDLQISKDDHYWFQYQLAYSLYEGGESYLSDLHPA